MKLIAADANFAAELKTFFEQGQRLAFRTLVDFFVADEELNLMR